jgi:hypothetical protein
MPLWMIGTRSFNFKKIAKAISAISGLFYSRLLSFASNPFKNPRKYFYRKFVPIRPFGSSNLSKASKDAILVLERVDHEKSRSFSHHPFGGKLASLG